MLQLIMMAKGRESFIPNGFYSLAMLQGREATFVGVLWSALWDSINLTHQLAMWTGWIGAFLWDVNSIPFCLVII